MKMKTKLTISLIVLVLGLAASGAAIFATTLGLDQNANWSRARIGLLLFGVTTMLLAPHTINMPIKCIQQVLK